MAKASALKEAIHEVAQAARVEHDEVHAQVEAGHGWTILLALFGIGIAAYWWRKLRNRSAANK